MKCKWIWLAVIAKVVLLLTGCQSREDVDLLVSAQAESSAPIKQFTLTAGSADSRIVYFGVGDQIDGVINPDLNVNLGDTVQITLINQDGMQHDLTLPDFNAQTSLVLKSGQQASAVFDVKDIETKTYPYFCTVAGHRQAGQEGRLIVNEP